MKLTVNVGEVMKKEVKTVGMNDTLEKAAMVMKNNKIGSVVVMGEKKVKGILTTRDVVYKHVASGKGETVNDIMTKDLITISPTQTIENAARLMVNKSVEKLLVFDAGKLVGIITNTDILFIEPALFEILLERMKIGTGSIREDQISFAQCENCGNYADDVEEIEGVYMCGDCKSSK